MTTASGSKVLLIEDDASMRAVLRTLLEIEGYTVSLASDFRALEGIIQAIREDKPEVILLDVHLRTISGFDVMRQLRSESEIQSVRVIMSSGMDVRDQCMAAGADDFLMKPYMPDELLKKLQG